MSGSTQQDSDSPRQCARNPRHEGKAGTKASLATDSVVFFFKMGGLRKNEFPLKRCQHWFKDLSATGGIRTSGAKVGARTPAEHVNVAFALFWRALPITNQRSLLILSVSLVKGNHRRSV